MFLLNGNPLQLDVPFTHDDIQYPANWLRLSTQSDRKALGITERSEESRPDDRYYWVTGNKDGTFSTTPKDLEMIRSMRSGELKAACYSLLAPSDYKIIRHADTGEPVDEATATARTAIRASYTASASALAAASDVEAIAALTFTWPETR